MSQNAVNLGRKCYCIVTGASQGIGKTIAIECSKKFKPGSMIVLAARSLVGLTDTKKIINEVNPDIEVFIKAVDLSNPTEQLFRNIIIHSIKDTDISEYELAMIIHNVGSVGDVDKKASDLYDLKQWQDYYALNVFGVGILNSEFMRIFKDTHNVKADYHKLVIVNITSLVGIKPFKNMAYYGSGKAAREMFFKVLAAEEENVLVLNYSPGPVDTKMIDTVIAKIGDETGKAAFVAMKENNSILTTIQTTKKFLEVLEKGCYVSGDHFDYYDSIESSEIL